MKPSSTPINPCFSSGPCAKRPGWNLDALRTAFVGRSHRHKTGKAKLAEVIQRSKQVLSMPQGYLLGVVPGSDTGALETALWSMLGARGVDVFCWESFGNGWAADCKNQLKLNDLCVFKADYGKLPDLTQADWSRDVVFTWNGTTSGVRVPNGDWIAADREGLTICDATSAVYAMEVPWDKLDVVTWSWQKVLGGEAAHGMLALSPRAVERLESFTPDRPAAQDLPTDQGRQTGRGNLRSRDHKHAFDAVRRGRARWPALGGERRRAATTDCALAGQPGGHRTVGGEVGLGGVPGRRCDQPLQHVDLPEDRRPGLSRLVTGGSGEERQGHWLSARQGEGGFRYRLIPRRAGGHSHLGRRDGGHLRHRAAAALA